MPVVLVLKNSHCNELQIGRIRRGSGGLPRAQKKIGVRCAREVLNEDWVPVLRACSWAWVLTDSCSRIEAWVVKKAEDRRAYIVNLASTAKPVDAYRKYHKNSPLRSTVLQGNASGGELGSRICGYYLFRSTRLAATSSVHRGRLKLLTREKGANLTPFGQVFKHGLASPEAEVRITPIRAGPSEAKELVDLVVL
ncbi:hypothetical protein B0H17DRAFT_1130667 [Mycena rosella]|uniref:Uncharacterized protein n=1 Tax=Mycena rosella TaxID=1033263 RepID=A0AAD7GLV2_MYCRO|nr:hypothetical protein B0H17DRAFT_1130667 [Mycena rosella]